MNHPQPEEWVPYIFGEATPEVRQQLASHLRECSECQGVLEGWRRSLKRLDRWHLPKISRGYSHRMPIFKWAAAAVLILSLGFSVGRLTTSPKADFNALRTDMERSLKADIMAQVRQELSREWQTELQKKLTVAHAQWMQESKNWLAAAYDQLLDAAVNASALDTRQQLDDFASAIKTSREADQQATLASLQKMQTDLAVNQLSLRHDLETVASVTDQELMNDRLRFAQLSTLTQLKPSNNP